MMNSVNDFSVFLNVILLFTLLSKVVQAQNLKVGDTCNTDGLVSILGNCSPLNKCPSAISNLRSGVKPTLCSTVAKGQAIVCCPTEERISERKCREYQRIRTHKIRLNSLLPLEFSNPVDDEKVTDSASASCIRANSLISQGRNAKENEFPFMAAIGYGDNMNTKWACAGSIISDEYVITAGHCINTNLGSPRRVLVGQIYLKHPSNRTKKSLIAVKEIFLHPEYRTPSKYNDLALLKLAKKLPLSKSICPICLPQPKDRLELNQDSFAISGWGTQGAAGSQSNILLTANIQRYSQTECQEFYKDALDKQLFFQQGIIRSQMCAADSKNDTAEKRDTCRGDSGGALSLIPNIRNCIPYLIGIVSFGSRLCGFGSPSVYTNVQSYLDWIEAKVWENEIKNQS